MPEATGSRDQFLALLTGAGRVDRGNSMDPGATNGSGYAMDVNGNFYGPAHRKWAACSVLRGNKGNGVGAIVGN